MIKPVKISRAELDEVFQTPRDDHPGRKRHLYSFVDGNFLVARKEVSTFNSTPGNATWDFPIPVRFRTPQPQEGQDVRN